MIIVTVWKLEKGWVKVTDLIDSEKFNLKLATQFIAGIPKGSGIDTGTWRTSGRAKKKQNFQLKIC